MTGEDSGEGIEEEEVGDGVLTTCCASTSTRSGVLDCADAEDFLEGETVDSGEGEATASCEEDEETDEEAAAS